MIKLFSFFPLLQSQDKDSSNHNHDHSSKDFLYGLLGGCAILGAALIVALVVRKADVVNNSNAQSFAGDIWASIKDDISVEKKAQILENIFKVGGK
jgi:hypothetical protein